jgi:PAS domain S-box-containing protein
MDPNLSNPTDHEKIEGFLRSRWLGWVLRYSLAVAAVAAATGFRQAVAAWIGPGLPTYITFYPAVMVVALLGGDRAGIGGYGIGGFGSVILDDAVRARHQVEQASAEPRRAAEQRRLALEAADLEAWDCHFQTGEVYWDERCREMWGIPQAEKIDYAGAIAAILIEDRVEVDEAVKQTLAGKDGGAYLREFRVIWPDGSVRWIASHGRVYFQGEGEHHQPARFIGANQDITERRQREEQLQKLNRTLKALSKSGQALLRATSESEYLEAVCRIVVEDCGHAMVWGGLAERDAARTVRPVACAGFEAGYLETLNVTWADTDRGREPTGTAIRTGKTSACANMLTDPRFSPWRQEVPKRCYVSSLVIPLLAEGRAFGAITLYSKQPEPFPEDGIKLLTKLADDVAYCVGALRLRAAKAQADLERDLAQAALRKINEELEQRVTERTVELRAASRYARNLIEASLDPVVTINPAGQITDVNEATELATGVTRQSLIGSNFSSYFTEPALAEAGYQKVLAEGLVRDYPLTIRHASGRTTDVLYHATVYRDGAGQVQGVFAAARDITEPNRPSGGGTSPALCWRSLRGRLPFRITSSRWWRPFTAGPGVRPWASASPTSRARFLTRPGRASSRGSLTWRAGCRSSRTTAAAFAPSRRSSRRRTAPC